MVPRAHFSRHGAGKGSRSKMECELHNNHTSTEMVQARDLKVKCNLNHTQIMYHWISTFFHTWFRQK